MNVKVENYNKVKQYLLESLLPSREVQQIIRLLEEEVIKTANMEATDD